MRYLFPLAAVYHAPLLALAGLGLLVLMTVARRADQRRRELLA